MNKKSSPAGAPARSDPRTGIEPLYREFGDRPEDGDDPLEYAFSDYRRDDTDPRRKVDRRGEHIAQKGTISIRKKEVGANAPNLPARTKEAAKKFGIPIGQVKRAKVVMEKGTPELQRAMRSELVSVSDASAIANELRSSTRRHRTREGRRSRHAERRRSRAASRHPLECRQLCRDLTAIIEQPSG